MNHNLRTAFRFAAYIRCMGGEPIPMQGRTPHHWAIELQRQHERLRQSVAPEVARTAKASAKVSIRLKGYRRAAEEAAPVQATIPCSAKSSAEPGPVDQKAATGSVSEAAVLSARERRVLKRDLYLCRKKLRHIDYWNAVQHALRLGGDVQTYP